METQPLCQIICLVIYALKTRLIALDAQFPNCRKPGFIPNLPGANRFIKFRKSGNKSDQLKVTARNSSYKLLRISNLRNRLHGKTLIEFVRIGHDGIYFLQARHLRFENVQKNKRLFLLSYPYFL